MTVGIEVTNTHGSFQINDEYRNMQMIASNQFTVNKWVPAQDAWYAHLAANCPPMTAAACMAIRCPSPGLNLSIGSYRGGKKVVNFGFVNESTVTFQYYIFDLVPPSFNNMGLQVFDVKGQLVYDAMDYPFKLIDTSFLTYYDNTTVRVGYAGNHSNLAASCLGGGNWYDDDGVDGEKRAIYTFWSNNVMYYTGFYDDQASGGGQGIGQWGIADQQVAIIDVTNYPLVFKRP